MSCGSHKTLGSGSHRLSSNGEATIQVIEINTIVVSLLLPLIAAHNASIVILLCTGLVVYVLFLVRTVNSVGQCFGTKY